MSFNLAVILTETARSAPNRPAAVYDGGQLTYSELDQASDRLAAALAAAGVAPGERVALQLPNIPQFLISYFGILKAGAVVVPLNVMLRAPEVAFHLGDSGAVVLITWAGVLAEAAKVSIRSMPSATPMRPGERFLSSDCWTPRRCARWSPGSRRTRPSSSTPQGRPGAPRAPSSATSSCT
jgi:acyl-CoA synthetase (AMP-forming)/AMP-acid ligase II